MEWLAVDLIWRHRPSKGDLVPQRLFVNDFGLATRHMPPVFLRDRVVILPEGPFSDFESVWEVLTPKEQARIIELMIESVCYNGETESIQLTFRPLGIQTLAKELANRKETAA